MRKTPALEILCILLLLFPQARAQTKPDHTAAILFDEFGNEPYGSVSARLDNVANAMSRERSVRVYIIVYAGRANALGLSHRYANRLKNYLDERARYFGFAPDKVIAIDGGRREKILQQIWFVPENAEPPAPKPSITGNQIEINAAHRYDRYPIASENDIDFDSWDGRNEDVNARLGGLAALLKKTPDLQAYILAWAQGVYVYRPLSKRSKSENRLYKQVRSRKHSDPLGTDIKMAKEEKHQLVSHFKIDAGRIIVSGCGYDAAAKSAPQALRPDQVLGRLYMTRNIELWVGPKNLRSSKVLAESGCRKIVK